MKSIFDPLSTRSRSNQRRGAEQFSSLEKRGKIEGMDTKVSKRRLKDDETN